MSEYPSEWSACSLGEITERVRRTSDDQNLDVLTISSTEGWVDQKRKWARDMAGKSIEKYTLLQQGEFSYNRGNSKTYPQGCVFRLESWNRALVPNVYHSFRTISPQIDDTFLKHFFAAGGLNDQLRSVITSSVRDNGLLNITADTFFASEIPVPPLPEQRKIAEILSGIDGELDACHKNLSRINLLRISLLKSMMQGAEEDSLEQALGSIVEVINGRAYKLTEWESEGTPVIRLQNLTKQGGKFYYSNLQLPEKQYCEKGDLLFMWSASFGPHIWWGERAIYHYHIWKMVPKDNALLKDYLYLFLQHKTEQWKSQGAGMAMIHLTKEGIEKEIIPLPPLATQERIVNAIKSIDDRIEAEKSKANKISLLKIAISSDLLSGRRRVSV